MPEGTQQVKESGFTFSALTATSPNGHRGLLSPGPSEVFDSQSQKPSVSRDLGIVQTWARRRVRHPPLRTVVPSLA